MFYQDIAECIKIVIIALVIKINTTHNFNNQHNNYKFDAFSNIFIKQILSINPLLPDLKKFVQSKILKFSDIIKLIVSYNDILHNINIILILGGHRTVRSQKGNKVPYNEFLNNVFILSISYF